MRTSGGEVGVGVGADFGKDTNSANCEDIESIELNAVQAEHTAHLKSGVIVAFGR